MSLFDGPVSPRTMAPAGNTVYANGYAVVRYRPTG